MEDFIVNLQSKVSSLQNQYINFVSYCSDLVLTHLESMRSDLIPERFTRETPNKLLFRLEALEQNYKSATKGFGFNISIKSVQSALTLSQQSILSAIKQSSHERELEKSIQSIFAGLSEIIYRDQHRTARKSGIFESKSTRHVSSENQHKKAPKISDMLTRSHQSHKKVSRLEIQVTELASTPDSAGHLQMTQKLNSMKPSPSKKKFVQSEREHLGSVTASPNYSPILSDSLKKTAFKLTSSADEPFSMGKLKNKLGNLANLLDKFAVFAANIETAIYNHPELQGDMNRFNSARKELGLALRDIIGPSITPTRSLDLDSDKASQGEVNSVRGELSKVQQELIQRNEEVIEINSQLKMQVNENKTFRAKISQMKQEANKFVNENEELRLEIIYSKSQIERHQKHNKILQENLLIQEKKLKDILVLQAKYGEIMSEQKGKPTQLTIFPEKKILTLSKVQNMQILQSISLSKEENTVLKQIITLLEADLSSSKTKSQHLSEEIKVLRSSSERSLFRFNQKINLFFEAVSILLSKLLEKISSLDKKALKLKNLNADRCASRETALVDIQKNEISEDLVKQISISLDTANSEISELRIENGKLNQERKNLLETRDRLISQCNVQSEELISQKLDIEETYSQKFEDFDYQIALLQGQIKKHQINEAVLNKTILENTEKYFVMCLAVEEKSKKIEELQSEISELRFRHSINFTSSGENLKEEIYTLKMKNIKLEQQIQESKLSQASPDEISNMKKFYISQISHIDEERKQLEKKLKDLESSLAQEKELVSKTQDNYAKRLAGANLEINTLKQQILDLRQKIFPTFYSNDEFNIVKEVNWGEHTWYLIEVKTTNDYIWLDTLPKVSVE